MELASMISGITTVAMVLSFGLWGGLVVYLVARWRSYREAGTADPQLGLKTALAMFLTVAYQVLLLGGFLFFAALFTSEEGSARSGGVRYALGVLVPAGLVFAAHWVALARTNAAELPLVPRLFAGVSLLVTGVAGFAALVALFTALIGPGEGGELLRKALAGTLVYATAWVVQGLAFVKRVTSGAPPAGLASFARPVPPPLVPPPG
jgi:hypothetical protein